MIYYFIKYPLRIVSMVFFRKLYWTNANRVPKDVPFVLAVNHPTAFIDPILIGSFLGPSVYFMLRGDMFSSKFVGFLLDQIKTIPIFRARDGFSKLRNNHDTLDHVYRKINQGSNILILAEGQTKHEKKMRPIQKGAARMLFGTYEKFGRKDMVVIPVGVNYTNSDEFRSKVMIDFGEAIPLADYLPAYEENPRKGIAELTKKISEGMQERIIHVMDDAREPLASLLMEIYRNNHFESLLPILPNNRQPLAAELKIADEVNQMSQQNFESKAGVAKEYQDLLSALGLKDAAVVQTHKSNWRNTLILIIGLVPFLIGYAFNALPLWLAKFVADKKVKKIEFHSSVRYGAGFILYLIYFIILSIVLFSFGWKWWMIFAIPFLGWFSLIWRDAFLDWNGARSFQSIPNTTKEEINGLRSALQVELD